ncbi:MAG: hypothetical protein JWM74_3578, partial [Myxococcaceae bacterium]|nr:hypothetical protein [Myxococcaceae bacterium]
VKRNAEQRLRSEEDEEEKRDEMGVEGDGFEPSKA